MMRFLLQKTVEVMNGNLIFGHTKERNDIEGGSNSSSFGCTLRMMGKVLIKLI